MMYTMYMCICREVKHLCPQIRKWMGWREHNICILNRYCVKDAHTTRTTDDYDKMSFNIYFNFQVNKKKHCRSKCGA